MGKLWTVGDRENPNAVAAFRWISERAGELWSYPAKLAEAHKQIERQSISMMMAGLSAVYDPEMRKVVDSFNALAAQCRTMWTELQDVMVRFMPDTAKHMTHTMNPPWPWDDHSADLIKAMERELHQIAVDALHRASLPATRAMTAGHDSAGAGVGIVAPAQDDVPGKSTQSKRLIALALQGQYMKEHPDEGREQIIARIMEKMKRGRTTVYKWLTIEGREPKQMSDDESIENHLSSRRTRYTKSGTGDISSSDDAACAEGKRGASGRRRRRNRLEPG